MPRPGTRAFCCIVVAASSRTGNLKKFAPRTHSKKCLQQHTLAYLPKPNKLNLKLPKPCLWMLRASGVKSLLQEEQSGSRRKDCGSRGVFGLGVKGLGFRVSPVLVPKRGKGSNPSRNFVVNSSGDK